eukprot:TRINITY_DN1882_c0_g2_i1.p1 TRINITY_DN1882_c0_g2~~TRINITY_DN1882_c0_g2_i1.p1  ORF type:complete len:495 (+),score=204.85 TRINITY_DN1882_c0_g2_i1:212-1696(+)
MSNGQPRAFETAVARAQELAAKLKNSDQASQGVKRPSSSGLDSDGEGPVAKKMADGGAQLTEQVAVPDKMVGMIIGRGGEQITRLQAESGCKIQMAPDSGGQPHRMCTLTGNAAAISQAKVLIDSVIANSAAAAQGGPQGGGGGGPPGGPQGGPGGPPGAGQTQIEIMVPGNKVGLVIGKGGETIKNLQMQTGAKIVVIQENNSVAQEKPVRITGSPQTVEAAKAKVMELLAQLDGAPNGGGMGRGRGGPMGGGRGGGRAGWPGGAANGDIVDFIAVSSDKIGLVIGKGGDTIKSINQASGAFVEIDKRAPQEATEKNFIIKGTKDNVERAKQMVLEKIGAAPGSGYGAFPGQTFGGAQANGGGGYPGGAPGGGAPGAGQADYSQQWIEYYRSQGMYKEAEDIERQQAAQAAANQAAAAASQQQAAAAGAPGGQADYSAQWAEYYRSVGKIKEAEAIEANLRAKSFPGAAGAAPAGYPAQGQYPPAQPGYYAGY